MNRVKILFLVLMALLALNVNPLKAQETKAVSLKNVSVNLDLVSRYIWRGLDLGSSPSMQPGVEFNKWGLTVGAWGSYAFTPGIQETDFYLGYTFSDIVSVTLTDYFFPDETASYNYFNYKKTTTGHLFELSASFNGTDKIPFTALIATNIYGADAKKLADDGSDNEIQHSTYAELGYHYHDFLSAFIGFNLTGSDTGLGETGFYSNKMGVINLGVTFTKEIVVTSKFSLPLNVSLITNPQAEKIYFVAGVSF